MIAATSLSPPPRMYSLAMCDPITPTASDAADVCRDVYVRVYVEPQKQKRSSSFLQQAALGLEDPPPIINDFLQEVAKPTLDGTVTVFDTETVEHVLTFGAYETYIGKRLRRKGVFYHDDLPQSCPAAFEHLKAICKELNVRLVKRCDFMSSVVYQARNKGHILAGYNVAYDVSRLAISFEKATKTARQGTRFCNGFAFLDRFEIIDKETGKRKWITPAFARIKRDDRHHVRYDLKGGEVLDVSTWAYAYTDRKGMNLKRACEEFGVSFEDRPGAHSGEVTFNNVAGCLYDVAKTSELLWALDHEHIRHPFDLAPWRTQSGASIAKAYLQTMGIRPRLDVQPDFPKELLGYAAGAYFGGRVEARITKTFLPVAYVDYLSMYPTVFALLGLWFAHLIPAELDRVDVPALDVEKLLQTVRADPGMLFDQALWKRLTFFAEVLPNGAILPARVDVPNAALKVVDESVASMQDDREPRNISIGPVFSNEPLWYSGPDLIAAALADGPLPRVVSAWTLQGTGVQEGLRTIMVRGDDEVDPRIHDFFERLIVLRKRKTDDVLDNKRRNTGYKCTSNSGAYGISAETSPLDHDPQDEHPTLRGVDVYGDYAFSTEVDRPEHHGRWCFFPTASLVTAGSRLMLALGMHAVQAQGGEVAYCDTDSMAIVTAKHGGYVPCEYGPYRLPSGDRAVRALSFVDVEAIRERFRALSPYKSDDCADVLKLEDDNFASACVSEPRTCSCTGEHVREQLWIYAVSEKSYALFNMEPSEVVIRKHTSHVIGAYRPPVPGMKTWIADVWKVEVRKSLGETAATPQWYGYPAIAQLTLSTWFVMRSYVLNCRPFDFVAVATEQHAGFLTCCTRPRPSAMLFEDPALYKEQKWRCLHCGKEFIADHTFLVKTYGGVVRDLFASYEHKRLMGDGSRGNRLTRGLTIPRTVNVRSKQYIGKETIVDPVDIDELPAQYLSITNTLTYTDFDRARMVLCENARAWMREFGLRGVEMRKRFCEINSLLEKHVKKFCATHSTIVPRDDFMQRVADGLRAWGIDPTSSRPLDPISEEEIPLYDPPQWATTKRGRPSKTACMSNNY